MSCEHSWLPIIHDLAAYQKCFSCYFLLLSLEAFVPSYRAAVVAYVEHCQELLSIEDERGAGVEVGLGTNSCPAALLYHPLGYTAVVSLPSLEI